MFTPSSEIAFEVLIRYVNGAKHRSSARVRMPKGFKTLGSGISRQAVLAPDGIVYKVGDADDNRSEFKNIGSRLAGYVVWDADIVVPRASLFDSDRISVIAMEYMERAKGFRRYCSCWSGITCTAKYQGECINNFYEAVSSKTGISDIHSDNLLRLGDNKFALIDLAF